jgi:cytochrome P450
MVAGHDTTAATLVWVFYELSRHPEVQVKLREEIKATRSAAGNNELGVAEFESMTYTIAVIKFGFPYICFNTHIDVVFNHPRETLRFYPIAPHNRRRAGRNELIPLSKPINTISGDVINAIPVRRDQTVIMSFWAYNRIKSLWGEDAEEWNPDRFLESRLADRPKNNLGVYANL